MKLLNHDVLDHFPPRTPLLLLAFLICFAPLAACGPASQVAQKEYMFWPPAPDQPHIQFLTAISSSSQILAGQGSLDSLLYGKESIADVPFARPYGIRMANGCIYACDATSGNLSVLDLRKKQVRIIGKSGDVPLIKPIDIAVAPDGIKYVADTGRGAVLAFDATDKYAGRIGGQGTSVPKLRPVSLALHGDELYVADFAGSCVRVFDRFSGKQLRTFGPAAGDKTIGGAMGIAIDSKGNLLVSDFLSCLVHKFSPDGKYISSLGGLGDAPGNFVRPKHMTIDSDSILYVVDNAFQNVQMFNDQGKLLMFFGASGHHPGAMEAPAGICTSDSDLDLFQQYVHPAFQLQRLVLVTNNAGPNRISVYGLGVLKPGKTLADLNAGRRNLVVGFDSRPPLDINALDEASSTQPATTEPATTFPAPTTAPATLPSAPATRPRA